VAQFIEVLCMGKSFSEQNAVKKYENIPKHVEVMLKNKVALFLWDTVYSVVHKTLHAYNDTKRSQASSNISAI